MLSSRRGNDEESSCRLSLKINLVFFKCRINSLFKCIFMTAYNLKSRFNEKTQKFENIFPFIYNSHNIKQAWQENNCVQNGKIFNCYSNNLANTFYVD